MHNNLSLKYRTVLCITATLVSDARTMTSSSNTLPVTHVESNQRVCLFMVTLKMQGLDTVITSLPRTYWKHSPPCDANNVKPTLG